MSDQSNPGPPPRAEDEFSKLLDTLQSNIGRYVAFILTPILLPLVGAFAVWAQDKIGFDIQQIGGPAAVVGFVVSVVTGLAIVLLTWLRNRGRFEAAAAETLTLLKAGQDAVANAPAEDRPTGTGTTFRTFEPDAEPAEPARPERPGDVRPHGEES